MVENEIFDYLNSCATGPFDFGKLESMLIRRPDLVDLAMLDGETCLHQAAQWYLPEAVRLLIKYGADVNAQSENGWTPLIDCVTINSIYNCRDGALECAQLLIAGGADPYIRCDKDLDAFEHAKKVQFDRSIYYFLTGRGDSLDAVNEYRPDLVAKCISIKTKNSTDFVFSHTGLYYDFGEKVLTGNLLRYTSGIYETDISSDRRASNCLLVLDIWPEDYYYIHIDDIEWIALAE